VPPPPIVPPGESPGAAINPTDPKALSDGHKAAAGDKTDPRYGGNCDPDQYDQLRQNQIDKCGNHQGGSSGYVTAESVGKCVPGMSNSDLLTRRDVFLECAVARYNVNQCFAGGDDGHRKAVEGMLNAATNCEGLIK
jgi:hypothetical protein